jgi:hypothetical protein
MTGERLDSLGSTDAVASIHTHGFGFKPRAAFARGLGLTRT